MRPAVEVVNHLCYCMELFQRLAPRLEDCCQNLPRQGALMKSKNPEPSKTDFPLGIGNPARSALEHAGYSKLKQLTRVTEKELAKLHGMGPKALGILRETLEAKGMSFATASKPRAKKEAPRVSPQDGSVVNEFMEKLDHPFKAEVQMIREIIGNVNKDITEQIKWNAPTFSYNGEYLVTFNLRATEHIHLVFHNSRLPSIQSELLEGDYEDRRMAYFVDLKDIRAKKAELERVIKQLVKLIGQ